LFSISADDDITADSASATLQFRNHPDFVNANLSLDPLDTSSTYNTTAPLLGRYHEIKLEVSKNDGANYYEIFRGYVGPASVSVGTDVSMDDTVTVVPCDLSFPYREFHFYDSLIYRGADAVSIMSQIFTDHGFNQSVTEVDAPGFHVEHIETGETNVWDAQKALITPTGYAYRIKWNTDAFKPCVYDPDRTKTTPDAIFSGTFSYRKIDISEADVRTQVVIIYRDRNTGAICYAQAEDEDARDKYGIPDGNGGRKHKTVWIAMQGSGGNYSLIDTAEEAEDLAGYVLHDLKEPSPNVEIRLPRIHPGIEIHDYLAFVGNDYTVNVGVTSVSWKWDANNCIGETLIRGTVDRVIGSVNLWLARDAHSPDVQRELEMALLRGDGVSPPKPDTPQAISYWGIDSSTGSEVPVVVLTVTPSQVWDHKNYLWRYWLNNEADPSIVTTNDPRLVLKGLPVGATLVAQVFDVDWSSQA